MLSYFVKACTRILIVFVSQAVMFTMCLLSN